MEGFEPK